MTTPRNLRDTPDTDYDRADAREEAIAQLDAGDWSDALDAREAWAMERQTQARAAGWSR